MQAPTLVVVNGDSFEKYANVSNIRKYADNNAKNVEELTVFV